ncbi:DUF6924 domain-containing protein [Thermomonospora umbrina]|uniref:DUF6924 domain-containing protein n=1 Tax=Thermomonospora umbrina TaxID=111806 RepID=UPI001B8663A7|nr:hypothetical protein [Thermomonospora umbrina]
MTPVVRTDFSDEARWGALCAAIATPSEEGFLASAGPVDDPAHRDLTTAQVVARFREARLVVVADAVTLGSEEMPLLFVDLREEPPGEIRVIPSQLWSIENNLSLANMDFAEFADSVDDDGVFRGF